MRFLYTTASLALFAAAAQAYSTGSPVCKSDDATLGKVAAAGKMGKQADVNAFAKTWSFALWDDNGKEVTDDSIMTNMDYWVTVKGGDYKGVMTYPMFDGARVPKAQESDVVMLTAGDSDNFGSAAKCANDVGQTITHMNSDNKDDTAKVAKVRVMDAKAGKFMMSGIVVTAKSTFGKAVTQQYNLVEGQDNGGGNNGTDNGGDNTDNGGNGGDNTGNGGNGGSTGTGADGNTNGTDPAADGNAASSISFVRPAIALQLVALAAFMLI